MPDVPTTRPYGPEPRPYGPEPRPTINSFLMSRARPSKTEPKKIVIPRPRGPTPSDKYGKMAWDENTGQWLSNGPGATADAELGGELGDEQGAKNPKLHRSFTSALVDD